MDCPKCKSARYTKNGVVVGRQRYKCKECGFNYTVERKSDVKSAEVRKLALDLYLEGLGFRAIGRALGISYGTAYQWIKRWGEQAELPVGGGRVPVVELDELHSYVQSKKTTDGYGLLLMDLRENTSLLSVGTGAATRGRNSKGKLSA